MTWQIYDDDLVAHYIPSVNALCMRDGIERAYRPWDVAQDVGRIPLCEKCRKKIRKLR